jgi:hypothetical protein
MKKTISAAMKAKGRQIWEKWLAAKIKAAKLRIQVDKIAEKILSEGEFLNENGEKVVKNKFSYQICEEEKAVNYFSLVENACTEAGLREGLKEGFCPALVAENEVVKIEWEILQWNGELIGDPKFAERINLYMDKRKEAIELFDILHVQK